MSNRRSRQSSSASRISDDQMIDLVSKLRQLLPEIRERRRSDKVYYMTFISFNVSIYIKKKNRKEIHFSLKEYGNQSNKRNQKSELLTPQHFCFLF